MSLNSFLPSVQLVQKINPSQYSNQQCAAAIFKAFLENSQRVFLLLGILILFAPFVPFIENANSAGKK